MVAKITFLFKWFFKCVHCSKLLKSCLNTGSQWIVKVHKVSFIVVKRLFTHRYRVLATLKINEISDQWFLGVTWNGLTHHDDSSYVWAFSTKPLLLQEQQASFFMPTLCTRESPICLAFGPLLASDPTQTLSVTFPVYIPFVQPWTWLAPYSTKNGATSKCPFCAAMIRGIEALLMYLPCLGHCRHLTQPEI